MCGLYCYSYLYEIKMSKVLHKGLCHISREISEFFSMFVSKSKEVFFLEFKI